VDVELAVSAAVETASLTLYAGCPPRVFFGLTNGFLIVLTMVLNFYLIPSLHALFALATLSRGSISFSVKLAGKNCLF
jgi:hypothetical protein